MSDYPSYGQLAEETKNQKPALDGQAILGDDGFYSPRGNPSITQAINISTMTILGDDGFYSPHGDRQTQSIKPNSVQFLHDDGFYPGSRTVHCPGLDSFMEKLKNNPEQVLPKLTIEQGR